VVDDFWLWSICKLILGCAVSARKAQQQASRGGWRGWVLTKHTALATLAVAVLPGSLVENAQSRANNFPPLDPHT
jgi:hypothetical protein